MSPLFVLLCTYLVYLFLNPIVDVTVGPGLSKRLSRIKVKIFFNTFVGPLLLLLAFLLIVNPVSKFLVCVFVLATIIRMVRTNWKYLTSFHLDGQQLLVHYLTPFLKRKSSQFDLRELSAIEVVNPNRLIGYPASVTIKYKEEWMMFEIIDKELKAAVQKETSAADELLGARLA